MMIKSDIGLVAAGAAFILFAFGAGWMALRLIRSNRAALITTMPAIAEQTFTVPSAGALVVSFEVPQLTTEYRRWELEVEETSSRRTHRMKWGGPRATGVVKGFSKMKVPIGELTLAQPDTLTFRLTGLAPAPDQTAYHIVLSRPHLARMALQIVGIVACGVGTLLSLLWGLWLLGVLKAS